MNVAKNIKINRLKLNLTQKQLAEKIGKTESTVRMWELGRNEPPLSCLLKLREIFDITLDELVD